MSIKGICLIVGVMCVALEELQPSIPPKLTNISARSFVGTGDRVLIGGLIIEGSAMRVLIQARGPELVNEGVSDALADPAFTVINALTGDVLMVNDNWEDTQGQFITDMWGGSPPLNVGSLSSAAVLTLDPGEYTVLVEGKDGTTGVALIEVFQLDSPDSQDPDGDVVVSPDPVTPNEPIKSILVFNDEPGDSYGADEYTLNSAAINEDTLSVNVSYGGGCETHQFTLIAATTFLESYPVQLPVSLAHNANGDPCEAWLTSDHVFDLTPIKTLYREKYQVQAGTVILQLSNASNGQLTYEF